MLNARKNMIIREILLTNLIIDDNELDLLKSIFNKLLTTGFVKPSLSIEEEELIKVLNEQLNNDKSSNK